MAKKGKSKSPKASAGADPIAAARAALERDDPHGAYLKASKGIDETEGEARRQRLVVIVEALGSICSDLDEHGDDNLYLYGDGSRSVDEWNELLAAAKQMLRKLDAPAVDAPAPLASGPREASFGAPRVIGAIENPPWPVRVRGGFISREGEKLVVRDTSGSVVRTFDVAGDPKSVCAAPDGTVLLVGLWGDRAEAFDVASAAKRWTIENQKGWVTAIAFSPDGSRVATGGEGALLVHDASTGKALLEHREKGPFGKAYRGLAWDTEFVTLRGDRLITWSSELAPSVQHEADVSGNDRALVVLGRRAVTLPYNNEIAIYDTLSGDQLATAKLVDAKSHAFHGRDIALAPGRDVVAVVVECGKKPPELQLWRLEPLGRLASVPLPKLKLSDTIAVGGVSFTESGDAVIAAGENQTMIVPLS